MNAAGLGANPAGQPNLTDVHNQPISTMPTLILSGRYSKESIALWKAAPALGWTVERRRDWKVPALNADRFAIYGEPLFADVICKALNLALLEPPIDWLPAVPAFWLNRDVRFATLAEARSLTTPIFVKPADNKVFDARVYHGASELPAVGTLPESLPVLLAEPVEWEVEFRCFMLNGMVQTLSPYWRSGVIACDEDEKWPATENELAQAKRFAEQVAASKSLPPAIVLDVGIIRGRGWSVVEANPAWAAGFYGCDPAAILPVLDRACSSAIDSSASDKRWFIRRGHQPV